MRWGGGKGYILWDLSFLQLFVCGEKKEEEIMHKFSLSVLALLACGTSIVFLYGLADDNDDVEDNNNKDHHKDNHKYNHKDNHKDNYKDIRNIAKYNFMIIYFFYEFLRG